MSLQLSVGTNVLAFFYNQPALCSVKQRNNVRRLLQVVRSCGQDNSISVSSAPFCSTNLKSEQQQVSGGGILPSSMAPSDPYIPSPLVTVALHVTHLQQTDGCFPPYPFGRMSRFGPIYSSSCRKSQLQHGSDRHR